MMELPSDEFVDYLRACARRVSATDLRRRGPGGAFSLVEHVCHLRDYEDEGFQYRIRRMLEEESPLLPDFPGDQLAIERNYRAQDFSQAIEEFARRRVHSLELLQSLSEEQAARSGSLGTAGIVSIRTLGGIVAAHDRAHRAEIEELLQSLSSRGGPGGDPDDRKALQRMAREFTAAFNSGDVDRLMQFYGSSYVDVNLRHPVQTHEQRRAYYSDLLRRDTFRIAVHPDEIVVEGDLALVRGRIELIPTGTASPTELRYLEVARKAPNGSWKAFWGMDGPIQESPFPPEAP